MTSRRKLMLASGGICIVAIWVIVFAYLHLRMPDVRPHTGDGRFTNRSWRFPYDMAGLPIPGYAIEFPHFDLSQDFEANYEVRDLPTIEPRVGIYLCVLDPEGQWRSDEAQNPAQPWSRSKSWIR